MHDPLPFTGPDPRELHMGEGEAFRRRTRAATLMDLAENVNAERRAEIAREILVLGETALPALHRAAAGRQENSAALGRSLVRLLLPDEIGRQIYSGLGRARPHYRVENGAVQIARIAYPNLPVQRVIRDIDELGKKAGAYVCLHLSIAHKDLKRAANREAESVVKVLGSFWRDEGFIGNTENYYSDKNSYMPDILERRTGLPITLSVLYLALARRLYLNADGVGLPGHFIVRVCVSNNDGERFQLIDPFSGARPLKIDECKERVEALGQPFVASEHLKAVPARDILVRMCNNLLALFDRQKKVQEAERVVTVLSHLQPRDPIPLLLRAERRLRRGDRKGARADFEKARSLDPSGPIGRTAHELLRRMGYENPFA